MSGISVDLRNELGAVEREARLLRVALDHLEADLASAPGWQEGAGNGGTPGYVRIWLGTQGIASGIEKIYTGCERLMARIASTVDLAPMVHGEGWHAALLRRMANPFPGVRGTVLTPGCHEALNRFRAFRHRERSSYGVELDPGIVLERGREMLDTLAMFRSEIELFLGTIDRRT